MCGSQRQGGAASGRGAQPAAAPSIGGRRRGGTDARLGPLPPPAARCRGGAAPHSARPGAGLQGAVPPPRRAPAGTRRCGSAAGRVRLAAGAAPAGALSAREELRTPTEGESLHPSRVQSVGRARASSAARREQRQPWSTGRGAALRGSACLRA